MKTLASRVKQYKNNSIMYSNVLNVNTAFLNNVAESAKVYAGLANWSRNHGNSKAAAGVLEGTWRKQALSLFITLL